jgi:enamine deaminase RidA (YjgF/YER057c/UK114 family)
MWKSLQPEGWRRPLGYSNGVVAAGRLIHVAGQIGWNADEKFETDDLVGQIRQALLNIAAVLAAGRAEPRHVVSLTWYFLDKREYLARLNEVGAVYREVFGKHFPAMTAVEVKALIEDRAKVEIQAVAVAP